MMLEFDKLNVQVVPHFNKAVKKLIYQRFKAFKHLLVGEWGNAITFQHFIEEIFTDIAFEQWN